MSARLRLSFVAATLVLAAATACDEPIDTPVASDDLLAMGADYITFGMVSYLTATGVREGRVEADTAFAWEDSANVAMRVMEVVFYDENGRPRATVTANRGELNERTDNMIARGNVVLIVHADGMKVESPELHYDPQRDRIWSDSSVVRTLNGRVTRGTAFTSDLEFRNFRIENPQGDIGQLGF